MFLGKVKTSLGIYQVRIHAHVLISMTFSYECRWMMCQT
jgi:hypothetical protein